jgi:hypothetical protein
LLLCVEQQPVAADAPEGCDEQTDARGEEGEHYPGGVE